MEIELHIEGGKYPVVIIPKLLSDGKLYYYCEFIGSTISTFPARKEFKGSSIENVLAEMATALHKAIIELMQL